MVSEEINVVIQGGLQFRDFTLKAAEDYAGLDFVTKVVISTWEDEQLDETDVQNQKIVILKNTKPANPGPGNMNLQLRSSLEGVKLCDDGLIMKTRSDQHLFEPSFCKWMDFFQQHKSEKTLKYLDGTQQKSKIFLIGNNKLHPFHPQDHFLWGYKQDLLRLLDAPEWGAPAWTWRDAPVDFTVKLRPPVYFGMHYYRQFYADVEKFMHDEKKYLLDGAPQYSEAMEFYTPIRDSIFRVFPRIDLRWEKYNSGYWYSYEAGGEYYAD